jgi:hypothetical protein
MTMRPYNMLCLWVSPELNVLLQMLDPPSTP